MKFIIQLIVNVAMSFMESITKMISGYKQGKNDIYFLICGILLVISVFNQWVLILAFLALLPSFHEQLTIKPAVDEPQTHPTDEKPAQETIGESNDAENTTTSVMAESDQQAERTQGESDTEEKTRTPRPKSKKRRPKPPPSEKKRSEKEDWGIPTLRVKDQTGKLIPVNSEKPVPIESDYFKGFILIMVKCDGEHSEYNRYASHFAGKQRKFEVQFQVIPNLLKLS